MSPDTGRYCAVFIDADNVKLSDEILISVEDKLRELDLKPVHKAAYADWSSSVSYIGQRMLTDYGYAVQQFPCAPGKNSADLRLAVDAGWVAATMRPQAVVIFSSDRDFLPVLSRLRQFGIEVFVFLTDPTQMREASRELWQLATDNNEHFLGRALEAEENNRKYFEEYRTQLIASVKKNLKIRTTPPTLGAAATYVKLAVKPLGKLQDVIARIPELRYEDKTKRVYLVGENA